MKYGPVLNVYLQEKFSTFPILEPDSICTNTCIHWLIYRHSCPIITKNWVRSPLGTLHWQKLGPNSLLSWRFSRQNMWIAIANSAAYVRTNLMTLDNSVKSTCNKQIRDEFSMNIKKGDEEGLITIRKTSFLIGKSNFPVVAMPNSKWEVSSPTLKENSLL